MCGICAYNKNASFVQPLIQVFRDPSPSAICFCSNYRQYERKRTTVQPAAGVDRHLCYLHRHSRTSFVVDPAGHHSAERVEDYDGSDVGFVRQYSKCRGTSK